MPEGMVRSEEDLPRPESADEDLRDEVLGARLRRRRVEREDERRVDARASEEHEPVLERRERDRLLAGQHLARMPVEGHDDGVALALVGPLHELAQDALVTAVDAVEDADRRRDGR